MRQLIAGNWKMHGLAAQAAALAREIRAGAGGYTWPTIRLGACVRLVWDRSRALATGRAMIVVGAPNSSNSLRLVEVAERQGDPGHPGIVAANAWPTSTCWCSGTRTPTSC